MNRICIIAFGMVAEKIGSSKLEVTHLKDMDSVKIWLETTYPELKQINYTMAYNRRLVHENITFTEDGELALLPPYSGG